jgi:hypothetical protein
MTKAGNKHEARAAATGYLYQCRYALLVGLQAIPDAPELEISVEKFDDVAFEAQGELTQLIQTKHHIGTTGSLSDASADLWKTLLIWSKRVAEDVGAPFRIKFVLLTTGSAPDGSAASYLRMRDRDETAADQRLLVTAAQSKNKGNADAYAAYKALPEDLRLSLLKAVQVLDGSSNIIDVRDEIVRELYHAASRNQIDHLVERLEGWWFGVVIKALSGTGPSAIPVLASPEVVAELDKRPFVRQLRKIQIGPRRVEMAIRDYYRASEQRSCWAREELLVDGELENFERVLVEAWEPRHAAMIDELAATCQPAEKVAAGQILYKWVEADAHFSLRSVHDRFLTHGSYHILANRYALGWHPDYHLDAKKPADGEEG